MSTGERFALCCGVSTAGCVLLRDMLRVVQGAILVQARSRLETVTVEAINLESENAFANALQNPDVRASRLVIKEAFANEGPLLQGRMRFRPSAMGRALPFRRLGGSRLIVKGGERLASFHLRRGDELRDGKNSNLPWTFLGVHVSNS